MPTVDRLDGLLAPLTEGERVSEMKVVTVSFSSVDNFAYLVLDESTMKCAVIDISNQWEEVAKVHHY